MDAFALTGRRRAALVALLLLAVALLLAWWLPQPHRTDAIAPPDARFESNLSEGAQLGQRFALSRSALSGIELFLARRTGSAAGTLVATLHRAPNEPPLAETRLPVAALPPSGALRLRFPTQPASRRQRYFVALRLEGSTAGDALHFEGAGPLSYLDGARYRDGQVEYAQLRFTPLVQRWGLLVDGLALAAQGAWLFGVGALLVALPGHALLRWAAPEAARGASGLLLSPSVGMALVPLLYLLADSVGLPVGRATAVAWVGGAALLWLAGGRRQRHAALPTDPPPDPPDRWAVATLGLLLGLVAATRLWPLPLLDGPLWGDSVQHTVMAQAMVDQQGLLETWLPYAPYQGQTTHFGFSALVALFTLLSGQPTLTATLWVGQFLNVAAIAALYPLARHHTGQRWAGVGALLVAGLLMPSPAIYLNWGRYAQLAGQVVLPGALLLFTLLLERPRLRPALALLVGATLAGMALDYYRMPVFFALYFAAWGLLYALPGWRGWRPWALHIGQAVLVIAALALLLLPWLGALQGSTLSEGAATGVAASATRWQFVQLEYQQWRALALHVPLPLVALALLALLLAAWQRARWPWLIALWLFFLVGSKATLLLNLPLAKYLQTFAVQIMLYIPVAWLLGWAVGEGAARAGRAARPPLALLTLLLALVGAAEQRHIVEPSYELLTQPDLEAMAWLRDNTPAGARFLVNGFPIYNDTSAVGADAGWWLPLLAGRANTMPPQYALLNEQPIEPDYSERVVALLLAIQAAPNDSPAWLPLLCAEGITHIYSGQRLGWVGAGAIQLLNPPLLEVNPGLREIYRRDLVRVFELAPGNCEESRDEQP